MVAKGKPTGLATSIPAGLAAGTIAALLWTVVGAAITAGLISGETLPESAIGYGALVILITASFLSAQISFHKIKHRRALVSLAAGGIFYLVLLSMNALFFGGQYAGMGVTALAVLAGCGTSLLLGLRQGRGRSSVKYKIPKA